MKLAQFVDKLTVGQSAFYRTLLEKAMADNANVKDIMSDLSRLAGQVLKATEKKSMNFIMGEFRSQHLAKRPVTQKATIEELAQRLPYPLGLKLRALLRSARRKEEGEAEPQFAWDVCSVMGLVVRLLALIGIQSYLRVESGKKDADINHRIMDTLRAPSDGAWLSLAQHLSKNLRQDTLGPLFHKLSEAFRKKVDTVKPGDALGAVVSFRNSLIHGETMNNEEVKLVYNKLISGIRGLHFLAEYDLYVKYGEEGYRFDGDIPQKHVEISAAIPDGELSLVCRCDASDFLSLFPLLIFVPGADGDGRVEINEIFFLNAGSADQLSYIAYRYRQHMDGKDLGSYAAFRQFMAAIPTPPIPKEPRINFRQLVEYHTRLFVGRLDVLDEIAAFVKTRPKPYAVLKSSAGMGKTALMAKLHSMNPPQVRTQTERGSSKDRWVYHFCMPSNGCDGPVVALRSIIAQVCDTFGWERKLYLASSLNELKDRFGKVLDKAQEELDESARLVVVVDALDESITVSGNETISSCLPKKVPDHVCFVVSYRVTDNGSNVRVGKQLEHIKEDLHAIKASNPLGGLTRTNVAQLLVQLADAESVAATVINSVWDVACRDASGCGNASIGADPFYLRFITDGVEQKRVNLMRAETVPQSLDDAFDGMWMSLPKDRNFLLHQVLCTLAIMRDYGDDELFAALFNCNLKEGESAYLPEEVAMLRSKAGKLLTYDNERYGLFHDRFRVYLVGEQKDPIAVAMETA